MKETLGFIGLGNMGQPMAHNLLAVGYPLRVYDMRRQQTEPLVAQGALVAATAGDTIEPGGIVVSMVPNDAALREIALGEQGVLQRLGRGGIHLSLSTISPQTTAELVGIYADQGSVFLGANVIGRPELAAARKIALILSGPHPAKERIRLLCLALGEAIYDVGDDPLAANTAKLLVNFLLGVNLAAISEALALGERQGLDRVLLADILRQTQFNCVAFNTYAPMIASKSYTPNRFSLALGYKDLSLVAGVAERACVPMPLLDEVLNLLTACIAQGWEGDWSSLDRATLQAAGLPIASAD